MNFESLSRRDDLISACYMLLTLLNQNQFPMLHRKDDNDSLKKRFDDIYDHKKKYNLKELS